MYEIDYDYRGKSCIVTFEDEAEAISYAKLLRKFGQRPWLHVSWYEYDFEENRFEHAGL